MIRFNVESRDERSDKVLNGTLLMLSPQFIRIIRNEMATSKRDYLIRISNYLSYSDYMSNIISISEMRESLKRDYDKSRKIFYSNHRFSYFAYEI